MKSRIVSPSLAPGREVHVGSTRQILKKNNNVCKEVEKRLNRVRTNCKYLNILYFSANPGIKSFPYKQVYKTGPYSSNSQHSNNKFRHSDQSSEFI